MKVWMLLLTVIVPDNKATIDSGYQVDLISSCMLPLTVTMPVERLPLMVVIRQIIYQGMYVTIDCHNAC